MIVMSHRGFWLRPDEKNSKGAFERTIAAGFGTETDVRDHNGALVVAHDPPHGDPLPWDTVLNHFDGSGLPLAVNVKADGLAPMLQSSFEGRDIDWFAFDMSGPETVRYARANLPFFTRHSDIEPVPILYEEAAGVWLDDFAGGWLKVETVLRHVKAGKKVCLVSPDLHSRDPDELWRELAAHKDALDGVMLCTDHPKDAREYFGL